MFTNIFGRKRTVDPVPDPGNESKEVDGFEMLGDPPDISSGQPHVGQFGSPYAALQGHRESNSTYLPYGLSPSNMQSGRRETGNTASPVENVPFVIHPSLTASQEASATCKDINQCLSRIQINKETLNYDFQLERSVLQEENAS